MSAANVATAELATTLSGANNVLVLVPTMDSRDGEVCSSLLTVERPESTDVVSVTVAQSPDDRLESWRAHVGADLPDRMGIVDVGGTARSAAAATVTAPKSVGGGVTIEPVADPGDLTSLGIRISGFLADWEDGDNRIALCFHSLTPLLQYVDVQRLFRFLHVLTGRVAAVDGVAHFHIDPTAHDDRTINTIKTLFNAVVEVTDDADGWSVTSR